MDFFSWLGSTITDGANWLKNNPDVLKDASEAFTKSGKKTEDYATGIMSQGRALAGQSSGSVPLRPPTRTSPARIHGLDKDQMIYRGNSQDPWMNMFRRVYNDLSQDTQ